MTDRNKGILLMIASSVFFAFMATFVRLAGDLPTMEKVFFRNIIGFAVSATLIWKNGGSFWGVDKQSLLIRAFFGFVALVFYFYAIDNLPLGNAVILNQTSPFFVLILAFFWLKEKILKTQWVAVAIALFGVSLIVRPGMDYELFPALVGLMSAVLAAAAYTAIRHLRLSDHPQTIVFYFTGFTSLATLPFLVFGEFVMPNLYQFMALLGVGVTATIAQFLMTYAYRYCEAGQLSIYVYGNSITAMFLGLFIFGELPDIVSLIGVSFVLLAAYLNYQTKHDLPQAEERGRG